MKTTNQIVCVLRDICGLPQWVAASGRRDIVLGEKAMVGTFDRFEVRTGPSGSHVQTCYEPHRDAVEGTLDIDEFESSFSGENLCLL